MNPKLALALLIMVSLIFTSCGAQSGPEIAARTVFEEFAKGQGIPYQNEQVSIEKNDGTFATVRIAAEFRTSADTSWIEQEAKLDCRKVGSDWQCNKNVALQLSSKGAALVTATAQSINATKQAVAATANAVSTANAATLSNASPVAVVNGQTIRTDTFQKLARYVRASAYGRLQQLQQQKQQFGDDPTFAQFKQLIDQQIQQAQAQYQGAPQQAFDYLVEVELVKAEAQKRAVSVSDQEVKTEIEQQIASGKNFVTAPQAPTATPHILTQDEFKLEYQNLLTTMARMAGWNEDEYREFVRTQLLRRKLSDMFASTVLTTTEQIHARHILVETKEQADAALQRVKNGEDFAAVAKDVSKDTGSKDSGGDLGWFGRGQMVKPFEDTAFALKPNQISDPVTSQFGFHIIQLLEGPEVRPLDATTLRQKQNAALTTWLSELKDTLRNAGKLVSYYTPAKDPP